MLSQSTQYGGCSVAGLTQYVFVIGIIIYYHLVKFTTNTIYILMCIVCICVCFQGGYAAYRYAQPTAATAAAYSDR